MKGTHSYTMFELVLTVNYLFNVISTTHEEVHYRLMKRISPYGSNSKHQIRNSLDLGLHWFFQMWAPENRRLVTDAPAEFEK